MDKKVQDGYKKEEYDFKNSTVVMKCEIKETKKAAAEQKKPHVYEAKTLKKYGIDKIIDGKTNSKDIREKIIEYIRGYNQLRELEDKNIENQKSVKYSTREEVLKKMGKELREDDIGGYFYHDVNGYELEHLVQAAVLLEDKPMDIEDWIHLYKHLVNYFGD